MARKRRKGNQTPRRGHLRSVPTVSEPEHTAGPHDQALIRGLRQALRGEGPLPFLEAASMLLAASDPRTANPLERDAEPVVSLGELMDSFIGVDIAETTAALAAVAALSPDDVLTARLRRAVALRRQPMPDWLASLDEVEVTETMMLTHVLGDGDDYLLGARLPSGDEFVALVYVDHNMGTIVKDAFFAAEPFGEVVAKMRELATDPGQSFEPVEPALVRAAIAEAIDHGAMVYPPVESDTWPACRPLVEWLVRQLPAGGVVPERHEWSEEERGELGAAFFASSYGRGLDGDDERELLDDLIWFGSGWGSGNPLRWSEVNVEILLADWIPRKIVADVGHLAKAPDLLRAFIRFGHEREDIPRVLTVESLAAVDTWEPEYQRLIRTERPQGAEALARTLLDEGHAFEYDDDLSISGIMLESLERAVGSPSTLLTLDDRPLPDEPFVWDGIPEDIHDRVREVLELCDACADEVLDVEHRTAMRRFLGRAAAGDPAIFRRKGRADRAAAAVAWVIGRANDSVGTYHGMTAGELLEWFGVTGSVSDRAQPFLRANGVDPHRLYGGMDLGAPDLLVGRRRADIIAMRDRYRVGAP